MPLDRSPSGRGGDGVEDGGLGPWVRHLDQPARGHGWVERRGESEVSFWLRPPTTASTNLQLSSPSEAGGVEKKRF